MSSLYLIHQLVNAMIFIINTHQLLTLSRIVTFRSLIEIEFQIHHNIREKKKSLFKVSPNWILYSPKNGIQSCTQVA